MPPSTTTADAASSVQISFYDADGKLNPDFGGQLHDLRDSISISLTGDSSKVLSAQAFLDSADATSTASLKSYPLQIGRAKNTIVETDEAFAGMTGTYDFALNTSYVVKLKITSNTSPYNAFYARFSIGGAAATLSYKFIYRTVPDTLTPSVENVNEIQTGSTIKIAAPMVFTDNSDARRPKELIFTFDVYESLVDTDNLESLVDTDNLEGLNSYTVTQEYKPSNEYTLTNNQLQNDNKYALTVTAVYADGYSISANVVDPLSVVASPIILTVDAYGQGIDQLGAGDSGISNVMTVTMVAPQADSTVVGSADLVYELRQDKKLYHSYTMSVLQTGPFVYSVVKSDASSGVTLAKNPTKNANGSITFDVTAIRIYGNIVKTSNNVSATFTSDITGLASITIDNAWIRTAVSGTPRRVTLDSSLTIDKWNKIAEQGVAGQFKKTAFFGSGITSGMYTDLDTAETKYKFEVSNDGGTTFEPVTSLQMKQGAVGSEDRTNYIDLLDAPILTNSGGIYDNITWSAVLSGPSQPDLYFLAPTTAPSEPAQGVYTENGITTSLTNAEMTVVKADSTIVPVLLSTGGWGIKNGASNGVRTPKVSLYYYKNKNTYAAQNETNSFTFSQPQSTGLGTYAVFDQQVGAHSYPFILVYTTPTGTNDKTTGYLSYKSKLSFGEAAGVNPNNAGLTLIYTGTDSGEYFSEIPTSRRIQYEYKPQYSDVNTDYATATTSEFVNVVSLNTPANPSTAAGQYDFHLFETGVKTSLHNILDISLRYNVYTHTGYPAVFAVSIIAPESTRPAATKSNTIKIINKINTPTGAEPAVYDSSTKILTVSVDDNYAVSYDNLTSVLFTSNLNYPNNSIVKPKPTFNTNNIFTFGVKDPEGRLGAANPCTFTTAYIVSDVNTGFEITGLDGPPVSIVLYNKPTRANYSISNFTYKTINNEGVSSVNFDVAFNNANNAIILGLNVYFKTREGTGTPAVPSTLVSTIQRGTEDNQTNITITLSDKTWFNNWPDLKAGGINFVPTYSKNGGTAPADIVENLDGNRLYGLYNVLLIASTPATLVGGVKESVDGTYLTWDNNNNSTYDMTVETGNVSANVSNSITTAANKSKYIFQNLVAGTAISAKLKKKVMLPLIEYEFPIAAITCYGPTTNVIFTPMSISQTTMIISVQRGSNATKLIAYYANYLYNPLLLFDILNVTKVQLVNIIDSTAKVVPNSLPAVQPPNTDNEYDISSFSKSTVLNLKMQIEAGIKYTNYIGTAGSNSTTNSTATYLTLPSQTRRYNVAEKPTISMTNPTYTVSANGSKVIKLKINTNGMKDQGISSIIAIFAQEGDYTNADDPAPSGSEVVLAFGPGNGTTTYANGANPTTTSSTDFLAPYETQSVSPLDMPSSLSMIETDSYTLQLGSLDDSDASSLTLPSVAFNSNNSISMMVIANTGRGSAVLSSTLTRVITQVLTSTAASTLAPGATLNLASVVTSDNTDTNAQPILFSVSGTANSGSYNSTTKVITAGTTGSWTVTASQAGYTKSSGIVVLPASITFTIAVTYITFNGTTYKYTGPVAGLPNPIITKGPGDLYFAVMSNVNDWESRPLLKKYIRQGDNDDQASTLDRFTAPDGNPVPLNCIVTNLMTNMNNLFYEFGTGHRKTAESIVSWDVSNVTDMSSMFENAINFNQDLRNWNVSSVTEFTNFRNNSSLTVANCPTFKVPAGITWTSRSSPNNNGTTWNSVVYGNGKLVATGANDIMTSSDGISWSSVPAPDYNVWNSVTYGNEKFVAVASSGKVMTSSDGSNWNDTFAVYNNMGEQVMTNMSWSSVAFGNNNLFVATGYTFNNSTGIMTSTDGTYWDIRTSNVANADLNSVTYGNGIWVIVGTNKIITSSTNAASWTVTSSNSGNLNSVIYANGTFVAVGGSGLVMTSPDGFSWTSRTSTGTQNWTSVAYGSENKLFVAVAVTGNGNKVMTSPDGIIWTGRPSPNDSWLSVSYHPNNTYVAVGYYGKIMSSTSVIVQLS